MPNRILRDWTDSKSIDKLSAEAERFFVRLMMKADDFGCYHAHPRFLRIHLYPWKFETITDDDINGWLKECESAGLIQVYGTEDSPYLMIFKFNQVLRIKNRKYPAPPSDEEQQKTTAKPTQSKRKSKAKQPTNIPLTEDGKMFGNDEYNELRQWQKDFASELLKMPKPLTQAEFEKLRETYSVDQIKELLQAMGNSTKLKNYNSTYGTFLQWAKNQRWTTDLEQHNNNYHAANSTKTKLQEKLDRAYARGQGSSTSH